MAHVILPAVTRLTLGVPAAQTRLPGELVQELEEIALGFDTNLTLVDLMTFQQQCG